MLRLLLAATLVLGGCRGTVAAAPEAMDLESIREAIAKRRHFIGPGDSVDVQIYREKELSLSQIVSQNGTISLPVTGEVRVAGRTRVDIETELRQKLEKSGLSSPRVSVLIKKMVSAKVSVYGKVKKPGTFPYEAGMTVVHAITLAAGLERTAQQDRVIIIHPNGERLEVPLRQIGLGKVPNVPLLPGDVIYVPESYF
jgi:polysaccharide export outer membrane protein